MTSKIPRLRYDAVRYQQDSLTRTLALLNSSGVEIAMRQMQRQQSEIRRLVEGSLAQYSELFKTTRQLYDLSSQTASIRNMLEQSHASWLCALRRAAVPSIRLDEIARLALSDISYESAVTGPLMSNVNYDNLRMHLNVQFSVVADVQRSMSKLLTSYRGLAESFLSVEDFVQLPSFVLPGATRELSTTSHALDVLCPVEDLAEKDAVELEPYPLIEQGLEASGVEALLGRVDPRFVTMYRGAVAALNGNNPDRSRQVLTSLRELWNHVFRAIAPKEEVEEWVQAHGIHGYLHNGQPTRQAKIRYISKEIGNEPLVDFVDADTKAMLNLYDLYGRLHELETGVTDAQLRTIVFRTETHLIYILRVREWSIE